MSSMSCTSTAKSDGEVRRYEVTPSDFAVEVHDIDDIAGGDAAANAGIARAVLGGESGARADIVALNAAAALYVSGAVPSVREGVALAREAIACGKALAKLEELIRVTNELA